MRKRESRRKSESVRKRTIEHEEGVDESRVEEMKRENDRLRERNSDIQNERERERVRKRKREKQCEKRLIRERIQK